jgi:uncharacterized protein (TIGR00290 family)
MGLKSAVRYALATGAGKDATLALHRARASGLVISLALCVYDRDSGRVRFHGTRKRLVEAQARALGMEPLALPCPPGGFEEVFQRALAELKVRKIAGVVFGNIHLTEVRAWYEERTSAAKLRHVEPLWGAPPGELVREVLSLGYRPTVVSVDLAKADADWVGRELTLPLVQEMEGRGLDPCGEHGEYHTFVFDGPLFHAPVLADLGDVVEQEGHRLIDLRPRAADSD